MQSLGYDLIVDDDGIIQEAGKIVEKTEDFEQMRRILRIGGVYRLVQSYRTREEALDGRH